MNYVRSFWWRLTAIYCTSAIILFLLSFNVVGLNSSVLSFIFIIGLIPPLLAGLMGIRHSRYTNDSIANIAEGARKISSGNLDYRIPEKGTEYLPQLSQTFNTMADTVSSMLSDLDNERVKVGALLETMEDGVMVLSKGKEILMANGAAKAMLGLQEPYGVLRDHDLQEIAADALSHNQRREKDIELLEGRRIVMALAVPLLNTSEGDVLMTLHDLTTINRTDTTRREFVSNVSHELRNPLASMKALVETLENGAVKDSKLAEDYLNRLHGEVDRMSGLVIELLDLSKLESGQDRIVFDSVNVCELLIEIHRDMLPLANNNGVALSIELEQDLPECRAEYAKLRRVILNLLDNSIRFVNSNGQIQMSAKTKGNLVVISVADNGIGINSEDLPHLFERFYKVDRSRSDSGTGLGLAIAQHIVEAHGGTIWADSDYGVGSTFSFTLIPFVS